jgi:hypothetical protein
MKLAEKLAALYPGKAWRVVYSSDGSESVEWNEATPAPTESDLLPAVKGFQSGAITSSRNTALQGLTADWGGDKWDADEATSARIANALFMVKEAAAVGIPAPTSIPWRTADNKDRTLTIAELTQMGAAVFIAQQGVWAKQAQLKNAVAAAPNEAAVKAVRW